MKEEIKYPKKKTRGLSAYVLRLVSRFGEDRVFTVAARADNDRRDKWMAWIDANPQSGNPGIYRPEAIRQSDRMYRAHNIASIIYHKE